MLRPTFRLVSDWKTLGPQGDIKKTVCSEKRKIYWDDAFFPGDWGEAGLSVDLKKCTSATKTSFRGICACWDGIEGHQTASGPVGCTSPTLLGTCGEQETLRETEASPEQPLLINLPFCFLFICCLRESVCVRENACLLYPTRCYKAENTGYPTWLRGGGETLTLSRHLPCVRPCPKCLMLYLFIPQALWGQHYHWNSHLTGKQTEAQRGQVTCPRSHS